MKVAYQGEPGAFSEIACENLFPDQTTLPCKTFRDVFEALQNGLCEVAVLPVENSLAGSVHENYDLILEYPNLHIISETQVHVSHYLLGIESASLKTIKTVLSHPQALMQSAAFLDSYPEWNRQPFYDTAGSAAYVAQKGDESIAAIASKRAAERYGLKILAAAIETNHHNYTRFFALAPKSYPAKIPINKASIVFTLGQEIGSLARVLTKIAEAGFSLIKLESRPIHGRPWQYMFYADMELHGALDNFEDLIKLLPDFAGDLRVLGTYHSDLFIAPS